MKQNFDTDHHDHRLGHQTTLFGGEVDVEKLYRVLRKSWIWILLIVIAANLSAYLVIRWTKPLFESYSRPETPY